MSILSRPPQATATVSDIRYAQVPRELRARQQWVCYKLEERNGKLDKVPYNARSGAGASTTNPATWSTFDEALASATRWKMSGVGYVFSPDDPYVGIDLDHCRDEVTGAIAPWALPFVRVLDSYMEVSPSGEGLHGFVRAPGLAHGLGKKAYEDGSVEMYSSGRFFTITGQHCVVTPRTIEERAGAVEQVRQKVWGTVSGVRTEHGANGQFAPPRCGLTGLSDDEVLRLCRTDREGEVFCAIYDQGDCSSVPVKEKDPGTPDWNRADWFIWRKLVFYLGDDVDRICALAEQSEHYLQSDDRATKWARPYPPYGTFQERQIAELLAGREREDIYGGSEVGDFELIDDVRDWARHDVQMNGNNGLNGKRPAPESSGAPSTEDNPSNPFNPFLRTPSSDAFPAPPSANAYYGLAGDIVGAIAPHTEADPAGLLAQLLTGFGNMAGRHAYFLAEADRHYANLFVNLVGETGRSRKGTGRSYVIARLRAAEAFGAAPDAFDPTPWSDGHIHGGLSSGEGVIHTLRDTKADDAARAYEPLLADKRMLLVQSEFSTVLKMMVRSGNTLSEVLRDAWDGTRLETKTKNSPEHATAHHVSLIGNITKEELLRHLTETDSANGFGNRFLWLAVKRAQLLPDGGDIDRVDFTAFDARLRAALDFAENDRRLMRDTAARDLWHSVYGRLTTGHFGLLGALTGRAEAYTMRLALVYALLDCSPVIRVEHLQAALSLWDYAERSVKYIFGDALGDPIADEILRALRAAYPRGLAQTAIGDVFQRNVKAEKIGPALLRLQMANLARMEKVKTGGRDAQVWFAILTTT